MDALHLAIGWGVQLRKRTSALFTKY